MKKLKRVVAMTSTIEGSMSRSKKIWLVSHPCPSLGTTPRIEGVVLAMPSDPSPIVALVMCLSMLASKAGASSSTLSLRVLRGKVPLLANTRIPSLMIGRVLKTGSKASCSWLMLIGSLGRGPPLIEKGPFYLSSMYAILILLSWILS